MADLLLSLALMLMLIGVAAIVDGVSQRPQ